MHATYVTGNHAHAAMFGVKGNVALAGMLFCVQHLVPKEHWNPRLVRASFWCLNGGIGLMMFFSLFPSGMYRVSRELFCLSATRWSLRHRRWH